jgi:hypothetical protein
MVELLTKELSPGAIIAAQRKRIEKTCPVCGIIYTGLPTAMACPKHAKLASQQRWRLKKKLSKDEK